MEDDSIFWERVSTMPYVEAEQHLRRRRLWALEQRMRALKAGDDEKPWELLVTKLNDEIHMVSQAQQSASLRKAMRDVLTPEQFEAVLTRLAAIDPRSTR